MDNNKQGWTADCATILELVRIMTGLRFINDESEESDLFIPPEDLSNIADEDPSENQIRIWLPVPNEFIEQVYVSRLTPEPVRLGFLDDNGELITSAAQVLVDDSTTPAIGEDSDDEEEEREMEEEEDDDEEEPELKFLKNKDNNANIIVSGLRFAEIEREINAQYGVNRMKKRPFFQSKRLLVDELDMAREKRMKNKRDKKKRRRQMWYDQYCDREGNEVYPIDERAEYWFNDDDYDEPLDFQDSYVYVPDPGTESEEDW